MTRGRLVSLIVAVAMFMENMDSTVIATSLPAIATDIGTNPLALKLAITSYLLSLAVFIPASGWTADRFGARTVFRAAIAVFMLGSILCAMADSLGGFVIARIIQGMGGAMMTPVGRLVLVRSVERRDLVDAMAWVTMPALIGPIFGPPVGGFITTYATWHWIFLINIPIGVMGIVLVTLFIEDVRAEVREPFDLSGMILSGIGVAGVAFGLSVAGLDFLPTIVVVALIVVGVIFLVLYYYHTKRVAVPVLDLTLFKLDTFRASVTGGFLFRLGVGAWPFLLPLLLQVGLGMTPFQSGSTTLAGAVGAMFMKPVIGRILRTFGFRNILVSTAIISGAFLAACALFNEATPVWIMFTILLIGGFFRSLEFTSINSLAYAEIPAERTSKATSLVAVMQQVSISSGVAAGALVVDLTQHWRGAGALSAADFPPAFLFVGLLSACASLIFMRLHKDAGADMANRGPSSPDSSDQRTG